MSDAVAPAEVDVLSDADLSARGLRSERADRSPLRRQLAIGDALALCAAWAPEALSRVSSGSPHRPVGAAVAVVVTLIAMHRGGLYRARVCALRSTEVGRVLASAMVGAAAFAAAQWVDGKAATAVPLEEGLLAAGVVLLLRWRFGRWLKARRSAGHYLRTVVMVGTNDDALALWTILSGEPELGYRIGGVVGGEHPGAPWEDLPVCADLNDLPAVAEQAGANGIIVVGSALGTSASQLVLHRALSAGLHVQVWPGLGGLASWRLRMAPVSAIPLFYVEPHRVPQWKAAGKRVIDVAVAASMCVISAPIMAVAALLIKIEDHGPIVYRSQRVGQLGAPITVFKFRTMVPRAPQLASQLAALNERSGGPLFKITDDPRVTKIGRLLRASSIDELPQLWNVMNGTMSLVGPRPALPSEAEQFDEDLRRRHDMRPGITGLWQIEARDNPSFSAYRRLDLAYVDNWSLGLDVMILVTTAHAVSVRALRVLLQSLTGKRSKS